MRKRAFVKFWKTSQRIFGFKKLKAYKKIISFIHYQKEKNYLKKDKGKTKKDNVRPYKSIPRSDPGTARIVPGTHLRNIKLYPYEMPRNWQNGATRKYGRDAEVLKNGFKKKRCQELPPENLKELLKD